jgi:hypothetical protein
MGCLEDDIDYALREIRRKTRIYVASSWRNEHQPRVVERLRELGFEVYDFRGCDSGWGTDKDRIGLPGGFSWSQIDPNWKNWTPDEYREALKSPLSNVGFDRDMDALKRCDICVFVMPCGPSASMEMGWAKGAGRFVVAYIPDMREPDLMVKMADHIEGEFLLVEHRCLEFHKRRVKV